jgi:hypothetical protein
LRSEHDLSQTGKIFAPRHRLLLGLSDSERRRQEADEHRSYENTHSHCHSPTFSLIAPTIGARRIGALSEINSQGKW